MYDLLLFYNVHLGFEEPATVDHFSALDHDGLDLWGSLGADGLKIFIQDAFLIERLLLWDRVLDRLRQDGNWLLLRTIQYHFGRCGSQLGNDRGVLVLRGLLSELQGDPVLARRCQDNLFITLICLELLGRLRNLQWFCLWPLFLAVINALIIPPGVVPHLSHVRLKKSLILSHLLLLLLSLLKDLIELGRQQRVSALQADPLQLSLILLLVLTYSTLCPRVSLLFLTFLKNASGDENVVIDSSLVLLVLH